MVEIIIEHVEMPDLYKRKYIKGFQKNKWTVTDTEENKIIYSGKFEEACLICHNLNKKYYKK